MRFVTINTQGAVLALEGPGYYDGFFFSFFSFYGGVSISLNQCVS